MALIVRRRKVRKGSKRSKKRGGASKSRSRKSSSRRSSSKRTSSSKSSKLAKLRKFLKTPRGKMALAGALGAGTLGAGGLAYHFRNPLKESVARTRFRISQRMKPAYGIW
jgi:hypothetical protein